MSGERGAAEKPAGLRAAGAARPGRAFHNPRGSYRATIPIAFGGVPGEPIVTTSVRAADLTAAIGMAALLVPAQGAGAQDAAPYDWSGGYVGGHAGWLWGTPEYSETGMNPFDVRPDFDGIAGGILAGYGRRVGGFVIGIEADGGLIDADHRSNDPNANDYTAFDIDWNAHLRARIGLPVARTLFYVAGGLAAAQLTVDDIDPGFGEDDEIHLGWTLGGGVEHALGDSLVVRVEYLYDDYGDAGYAIPSPPGPFFPAYGAEVDLTAHTVRAAAAWRF